MDVNLPAGTDTAAISAMLTVMEGANCSDSTSATAVTVRRPLAASITQKTMDGTTFTVTLTGAASAQAALQWQRFDGQTWVNISGATSSSLAYSSFEADATPTVQNFTIGGEPYQGQIWQVQLRLHATRTIGALVCEEDSAPVTVKKVVAVDP